MFERWITDTKTKQKVKQRVYSIQEKIQHYTDIANGKKKYNDISKAKAKQRLNELKELDRRTFDEPEIIVTDDNIFGNKQHKARGCVVVGKQGNNLIVAPINKRDTSYVVLDEHPDRQISNNSNGNLQTVDRTAVYETKYIDTIKPLTKYDKVKIKEVFKQPYLRKSAKK